MSCVMLSCGSFMPTISVDYDSDGVPDMVQAYIELDKAQLQLQQPL